MARSTLYDPLEKFRFIVSWSGLALAGFHDCQLPKRNTTKIPYREGIDQDWTTQSAGLNTFEDVVLSRGLLSSTSAPNIGAAAQSGAGSDAAASDFYSWVTQIHDPSYSPGAVGILPAASDSPTSGQAAMTYRKNVTIQLLDRDGNVARAWELLNAWPTHYTPGSDLNAGEDGEKSMESLTLAYEDFVEVNVSGVVGTSNVPGSASTSNS